MFKLAESSLALVAPAAIAAIGALPAQAVTFNLVEATIPEIQAAIEADGLTSEQLVQLYLNRIEAYDNQGSQH